MAEASVTKDSKRAKALRANRRRLTKAQAVVMTAKRNVAFATKQLTDAVRVLIHAQSGSPKEVRTAKVVRATTKGLVAARKTLRKAEKKRKKAAARVRKATPRSPAAAGKRRPARTSAAHKAAASAPEKGRRKPKREPRKSARRMDVQSAEVTVAATSAGGSDPTSEVVG